MQKFFLVLLFLVGVAISVVAGVFSVTGLTTIFRGAEFSVLLMGGALEVAKVCVSVYVHSYYRKVHVLLTTYLVFALLVLMAVTSLGVYGYLSKSYYSSTNSTVLQTKVSSYTTRIDVEKEKLRSVRDEVQLLLNLPKDERKPWHNSRVQNLTKKVEEYSKNVDNLTEQYVEEKTKLNVMESEVGPLKYLAKVLYGTSDYESTSQAVQVLIVLLVLVFDPLAILLILSSIKGFELAKENKSVSNEVQKVTQYEVQKPTVSKKLKSTKEKKLSQVLSSEIKDKVVNTVEQEPQVELQEDVLESVIEEAVAEDNANSGYEEQVQKMYNQTPMVAGRFKE